MLPGSHNDTDMLFFIGGMLAEEVRAGAAKTGVRALSVQTIRWRSARDTASDFE